ncbi:MAG: hypothetical protein ABJG88_03290 [Litorimonas sp.]
MLRLSLTAALACIALNGCIAEKKNPAVGFWKSVTYTGKSYIEIQENGQSYIVTKYYNDAFGNPKKIESAAVLKDGVMIVTGDAVKNGILYKQSTDQLVVDGKNTLERVSSKVKNDLEDKLEARAKRRTENSRQLRENIKKKRKTR